VTKLKRTTESLESLGTGQYEDAQILLSLANTMGWTGERLLAAVDALKEAKRIMDLKDSTLNG
jgi:hypothetical protein